MRLSGLLHTWTRCCWMYLRAQPGSIHTSRSRRHHKRQIIQSSAYDDCSKWKKGPPVFQSSGYRSAASSFWGLWCFPGHKLISHGANNDGANARGPDERRRIGFRWWNISGVLMGSWSFKDTWSPSVSPRNRSGGAMECVRVIRQ